MVLNTTEYLERYGWRCGLGLGKSTQGTNKSIPLRPKSNTHGIGQNESIDTFNNILGRYANIYNKSMDNITIVISSSDSDTDTDQPPNPIPQSIADSNSNIDTQPSKRRHFIKLGYGLNALGYAANTTIQQDAAQNLYMGFVRSTHAPLYTHNQQHQYGTSQSDQIKHEQNQLESTAQQQLLSSLSTGSTTYNTIHGMSTIVDSTVPVFDSTRQHMYHDRMPGKLRRLYQQELQQQQQSVNNNNNNIKSIMPSTTTTTIIQTDSDSDNQQLSDGVTLMADHIKAEHKSIKHKPNKKHHQADQYKKSKKHKKHKK